MIETVGSEAVNDRIHKTSIQLLDGANASLYVNGVQGAGAFGSDMVEIPGRSALCGPQSRHGGPWDLVVELRDVPGGPKSLWLSFGSLE